MSNLFPTWSFEKGSIGLGGMTSRTAISPKNNGGIATLHEPTIKALWWYAKAALKPDEAEIAVGEGENKYTGEIFTCVEKVEKGGSETALVVRNSDKTIAAAIYDGTTKPYIMSRSRKDGAEIIYTVIPQLLEEDEFFKDKFEEFKSYLVDGINIIDISDLLFVLCDHIYRSIELDRLIVKLDRLIVMGKIPQQLSLESIKDGTYTPSKVYVGNFQVLTAENTTAPRSLDLNKDFILSPDRQFSEIEKELMQEIPYWYIIPDYLISACKMITANLSRPVRNIMLRGEAGTGKTEAAKAMAAALHLPYVNLCCHPDMRAMRS